MRILLLILRYFAAWGVAWADYRSHHLTNALCMDMIGLDECIWRKNDLAIERMKSQADFNRWDQALEAISINEELT